ncbi:hypothetical protein B7Y94_04005 [Candidatus Saccharibacteria bacterium 32-49-12]|nr:MAG: hypothetical protein B7Y94_04005 [Candidatus Saccharibacteria bacterium 32-49-12]
MTVKTDRASSLTTIGRTTVLSIAAEGAKNVPAKVDTGADSSSIWASDLRMSKGGVLSFALFGKESKHYTGKRHSVRGYRVTKIRSSNGMAQIRYQVKLTVEIAGRKVRGTFTLADRSRNRYPILIGCRMLSKKFLVDVSRGDSLPKIKNGPLNAELEADPISFFQKYSQANLKKGVE